MGVGSNAMVRSLIGIALLVILVIVIISIL
jgi:hypothetical protein